MATKAKLANLAGRDSRTTRARSASRESKAIDPKKDFEEPTQLSHEELTAENPVADLPSLVQNGRMAVNYVKPHFEIEDDDRSVGVELSLEFTEGHREILPRRIVDAVDLVKSNGYKSIDVQNVPAHSVDLRVLPDDKEPDVKDDAVIEKVRISSIEDKGSGDAKDIIRIQFRAKFDLTQTVERFACRHFGATVWLKMVAVQGELLP